MNSGLYGIWKLQSEGLVTFYIPTIGIQEQYFAKSSLKCPYFPIRAILIVYNTVVLHMHFLPCADDAGHLFQCLFVKCFSSSVKSLLSAIAHFLTDYFISVNFEFLLCLNHLLKDAVWKIVSAFCSACLFSLFTGLKIEDFEASNVLVFFLFFFFCFYKVFFSV